ncbi:MAG: Ig-like domain-containing protein [bacterium]
MIRRLAVWTLFVGLVVGPSATGCGDDDATVDPVCGDGVCEGSETESSCPQDCVVGCGNGIVEAAEECDGTDFAGATCDSEVGGGGELHCRLDCTINTDFCCQHSCDTAGDTQCDSTVVQACEVDSDGCRAWIDQADCADNSEICLVRSDVAACETACVDECMAVDDTQCSGSMIQTCTLDTIDGCLYWVDGSDCADGGQLCEDATGSALCVDTCTDECTTLAEVQCGTNVIEECQQGGDGCNDWVVTENCAANGEICNDNMGTPACCANQCPTLSETRCDSGNTAVEVCGVGTEGCTEWQVQTTCTGGQVCGLNGGNAECMNGGGEDCTDVYGLTTGTNSVAWTASNNDYLLTTPSCVAVGTIDGPDVVMSYTATSNGFLDILVTNKPVNTRWVTIVSSGTCGNLTPEEACISEWAPTEMGGTISVAAGQTYYFYMADTSSGTGPLDNPFTITLTEIDCATYAAAVVSSTPTDGASNVPVIMPLVVDFDSAVDTAVGVITVTGSLGTSYSYDLSTSPTEVTFSNGDRTMTIDTGAWFNLGETVTVSWSGVEDFLCGNAVPPIQWVFDVQSQVDPGEDCSNPLALATGSNLYSWFGGVADYFTAVPCGTSTVSGPDVVGEFVASVNGFVTLTWTKPASQRMVMAAYDGTCGDTTAQLGCISDFTPTALDLEFPVQAGQSYFVYFLDTASGTQPLPNPLDLNIVETSCATFPAAVASNELPVDGATTTSLAPVLTVDFDKAVLTTLGTVTLTGDISTNVTYDLSTNPAEISFLSGNMTLEITPGSLPPGENITVTWSLGDAQCNKPIAVIPWTFTVLTPACAPGSGGMVGSTQTPVASGLTTTAEYYVVADEDPNGWVYVGGTTLLYRVPKAGGAYEDVEAAAGLLANHLGYAMLINGQDIFTIESATTGTTGRIWRISSDGGATWNVEDFATFPSVPGDDFRAATVWNGRIYLATAEGTTTTGTEIWSVSATPAAVPDTAAFEGTIANEVNCSALAADDYNFYLACSTGDKIIRVAHADKPNYVSTLVTDIVDASGTVNALHALDGDSDGVADFLYMHGWTETVWFVCDPSGTPYADVLATVTGVDYGGMGFDKTANALWLYEDVSFNLVRID